MPSCGAHRKFTFIEQDLMSYSIHTVANFSKFLQNELLMWCLSPSIKSPRVFKNFQSYIPALLGNGLKYFCYLNYLHGQHKTVSRARSCRFKWTRPFRRKTKAGFCACAITFQTQSNSLGDDSDTTTKRKIRVPTEKLNSLAVKSVAQNYRKSNQKISVCKPGREEISYL
jgi:hypothetical protein